MILHIEEELWDPVAEEFTPFVTDILLEHSLYSISKWEAKWHQPFLSKEEKTREQIIDYIKFMSVNDDVTDEIISKLKQEHINEIVEYINDPQTATTFREDNKHPSRKIITNEVIYARMVDLRIPAEYQYWHLNRLLTLIRVCEIQRSPPKKMGKKATMSRNAALNAARRKRLGTTG